MSDTFNIGNKTQFAYLKTAGTTAFGTSFSDMKTFRKLRITGNTLLSGQLNSARLETLTGSNIIGDSVTLGRDSTASIGAYFADLHTDFLLEMINGTSIIGGYQNLAPTTGTTPVAQYLTVNTTLTTNNTLVLKNSIGGILPLAGNTIFSALKTGYIVKINMSTFATNAGVLVTPDDTTKIADRLADRYYQVIERPATLTAITDDIKLRLLKFTNITGTVASASDTQFGKAEDTTDVALATIIRAVVGTTVTQFRLDLTSVEARITGGYFAYKILRQGGEQLKRTMIMQRTRGSNTAGFEDTTGASVFEVVRNTLCSNLTYDLRSQQLPTITAQMTNTGFETRDNETTLKTFVTTSSVVEDEFVTEQARTSSAGFAAKFDDKILTTTVLSELSFAMTRAVSNEFAFGNTSAAASTSGPFSGSVSFTAFEESSGDFRRVADQDTTAAFEYMFSFGGDAAQNIADPTTALTVAISKNKLFHVSVPRVSVENNVTGLSPETAVSFQSVLSFNEGITDVVVASPDNTPRFKESAMQISLI